MDKRRKKISDKNKNKNKKIRKKIMETKIEEKKFEKKYDWQAKFLLWISDCSNILAWIYSHQMWSAHTLGFWLCNQNRVNLVDTLFEGLCLEN